MNANATIRYIALEGGCWILETADGRYSPINLPQQYQVDGMRVYVVFKSAPSAVSKCMVAPLVSIDQIERR